MSILRLRPKISQVVWMKDVRRLLKGLLRDEENAEVQYHLKAALSQINMAIEKLER